ncbi:Presenilins-associated rhomboid-like protein, mitochondrial [Psilocybe cubensis]|uniref:Peptidase S54 rhomboid domain-containing protein n=2 Tax=Psilocybe cubensis TaxID=181762 RepID=A0A8H7XVD1_PSICU|nr:Presenilins-associated rhomboid-like protein, mitochondrial [Psilocybe cubensis]KAH9479680.1 Presenilins-associated rhomboid-like protein, mitochondrial [Psilocybe cubensis]
MVQIVYTPAGGDENITSSLRQELDVQSAKSSSNTAEGASAQAEPGFGASFYEKVGKPGIAKQVFFATVASTFALVFASVQTSIETDEWIERMVAVAPIWSVKAISNTDLKRAQNAELIQRLREKLANIQTTVQQLPVLIRPWINLIVVGVMQPYADASEGKRLCWKICLLNVGVWALWKVRSLRGFMTVRFMHNPLSGLSYTLLTSAFSHRTAIHLLCNCLALESFGSAAYYYLLREQNKAEPELLESTASYHFLAFFTSGNAKFRYPRLVAELSSTASATRKTETWASAVAATNAAAASAAKSTAARKTLDILPSLGASGAVYAAVTMTALAFPDSQIALFIPPSYPINIQYGVGGLMLLDVIGIARGWRLFDHWAHLGGAAFGVIYYNYGPTVWRYLRQMNLEAKIEEQNARKQS